MGWRSTLGLMAQSVRLDCSCSWTLGHSRGLQYERSHLAIPGCGLHPRSARSEPSLASPYSIRLESRGTNVTHSAMKISD